MKIKLGFSPCPNDTFIFHAMLHGLVDTEDFEFETVIADVEELNKKAFNGETDITKLSFFAFAHVLDNYILLNAGSALGNNCGPLLISKTGTVKDKNAIVAIPGKYTTANFLLSLYNPEIKNKKEYIFSEIENSVLKEEANAGLIIHENRFTYEQKGLKKVADLGEWWEKNYNLPIPLGGIAIKKSINISVQQKIDRVLKRSVEYALKNPDASKDYVKKYSQELSDDVIDAHINLYVNNFTVDLGSKGREAVSFLIKKASELSLINKVYSDLFVTPSDITISEKI